MLLLLAALACAPEPAPPVAPAAPPAPEPDAPPPGRIGGKPILDRPVVLGGLAADDVEAGIAAQRGALDGCYAPAQAEQPAPKGKVLVRFTVARDGHVADARVQSSSLRHPQTEACLLEVVAGARFPALATGEIAVVSYPLSFPPG